LWAMPLSPSRNDSLQSLALPMCRQRWLKERGPPPCTRCAHRSSSCSMAHALPGGGAAAGGAAGLAASLASGDDRVRWLQAGFALQTTTATVSLYVGEMFKVAHEQVMASVSPSVAEVKSGKIAYNPKGRESHSRTQLAAEFKRMHMKSANPRFDGDRELRWQNSDGVCPLITTSLPPTPSLYCSQ
jgi:hypothetical protein